MSSEARIKASEETLRTGFATQVQGEEEREREKKIGKKAVTIIFREMSRNEITCFLLIW
jgi:hypothetical protein